MARNRYSVPEHVKDYAVHLYQSGYTQREAGRRAGVSSISVLHFLREKGIPSRNVCHNKAPDALRQQAIALYVNESHTIPEVAAIIGGSTTGVARWLKEAGVTRPMGEAFAMAVQKGRKKWGRGVSIPWQSTKTGRWEFADSRWEIVRMGQLDADDRVATWTRLVPRIPYQDAKGKQRFYAPDFWIEYTDGSKTVEELKPLHFFQADATVRKAKAAVAAYAAMGATYHLLSEHDIGLKAINALKLEGLASITDEQRRLAHNKRRLAAWHRRKAAKSCEVATWQTP